MWFHLRHCVNLWHRMLSICITTRCPLKLLYGFWKIATVPSENMSILSCHFIGPCSYFLKNCSSSAPCIQVISLTTSSFARGLRAFIDLSPFLPEFQFSVWTLCSGAVSCAACDSLNVLPEKDHSQEGQTCSSAELNKDLTCCPWPFSIAA